MRFDNSFLVPIPPSEAWALLLDVPRIAPCLPGASLTEALADSRYKGQAAVKIGPVQLRFAGEAQLTEIDAQARTARVIAKGADGKGRGSAAAEVDFALVTEGAGTRVNISTELTLVGAVAQYGRGSGLIKEIASQLIGQFAANLEKLIGDTVPAAPVPVADATRVASVQGRDVGASPAPPAPRSAPPPPAISGFGLLWAALKSMFRRWLSGQARSQR